MSAESLIRNSDPEVVISPDPVVASHPVAVPIAPRNSGRVTTGPVADHSVPVGVPFADFIGRCFMIGCLCYDAAARWITSHQPPAKLESEVTQKYDWHVAGWLRTSLGVGSCTLAAGALVAMFWASSLRSMVPFVFVVVISYIAIRFGNVAGLVGTVIAALLFASVLFAPRPSLAIDNPADQNHLIMMIVVGICVSELLGRRKSGTTYKHW